uniref:Uncharacterized protein n=1 Tax=Arundo donax TaxID=35708 RepID=A0A0A9EYB1_ARUDO
MKALSHSLMGRRRGRRRRPRLKAKLLNTRRRSGPHHRRRPKPWIPQSPRRRIPP